MAQEEEIFCGRQQWETKGPLHWLDWHTGRATSLVGAATTVLRSSWMEMGLSFGAELWCWQGDSVEAGFDSPAAINAGNNGVIRLTGTTGRSRTKGAIKQFGLAAVMFVTGISPAVASASGLRSAAEALVRLPPTPTGLPTTRTRIPLVTPPSEPSSPTSISTGASTGMTPAPGLPSGLGLLDALAPTAADLHLSSTRVPTIRSPTPRLAPVAPSSPRVWATTSSTELLTSSPTVGPAPPIRATLSPGLTLASTAGQPPSLQSANVLATGASVAPVATLAPGATLAPVDTLAPGVTLAPTAGQPPSLQNTLSPATGTTRAPDLTLSPAAGVAPLSQNTFPPLASGTTRAPVAGQPPSSQNTFSPLTSATTRAPGVTLSPVAGVAPSSQNTFPPLASGTTRAPGLTLSPVAGQPPSSQNTFSPLTSATTRAPGVTLSPVAGVAPSSQDTPSPAIGGTRAPGLTLSPVAGQPSDVQPPSPRNMSTLSPGMATPISALAASTSGSPFSVMTIVAVAVAATAAAIMLGVCLRKKKNAKENYTEEVAPQSVRIASGNAWDGNRRQTSLSPMLSVSQDSTGLPVYLANPSKTGVASAGASAVDASTPSTDPPESKVRAPPAANTKHVKAADAVTMGEDTASVGPNSVIPTVVGLPDASSSSDIAKSIVEAARCLAMQSHLPGVCEAATLVSILVNLISDGQVSMAEAVSRVKRCRLVIMLLERASVILGKSNGTNGEMERMLIEDVQTAVGDMVELIKTYRSKRRISQVIVSTMFRRRMDEAEAVIDRAISDLKLGLHVHAEIHQEENRQIVGKRLRDLNPLERSQDEKLEDATDGLHSHKRTAEMIAESAASTRRLRRQRNLNQIEIPEEHVTISEELLGKGGFGSVYIADYNGRNAAAKVVNIDMALCDLSDERTDDVRRGVEIAANCQRASLLLELQTMIQLRSPHTVNVYGAMTCRKDRLVLVMELLTGGDLRAFLRHTEKRLAQSTARQIIEDVCAGMAFLHSKSAIHGDIKSPNILLDGEGRAKIADFGTSRWAQHSDSTGLATYRTRAGGVMQMMSFAWAAPEVLYAKGSSYASDVYSFGIVAWEVLSMEVPWADEALPLDIYRRVVFKGDRPAIPADTPADMAGILRACWAGTPKERPTSSEIMKDLKRCKP